MASGDITWYRFGRTTPPHNSEEEFYQAWIDAVEAPSHLIAPYDLRWHRCSRDAVEYFLGLLLPNWLGVSITPFEVSVLLLKKPPMPRPITFLGMPLRLVGLSDTATCYFGHFTLLGPRYQGAPTLQCQPHVISDTGADFGPVQHIDNDNWLVLFEELRSYFETAEIDVCEVFFWGDVFQIVLGGSPPVNCPQYAALDRLPHAIANIKCFYLFEDKVGSRPLTNRDPGDFMYDGEELSSFVVPPNLLGLLGHPNIEEWTLGDELNIFNKVTIGPYDAWRPIAADKTGGMQEECERVETDTKTAHGVYSVSSMRKNMKRGVKGQASEGGHESWTLCRWTYLGEDGAAQMGWTQSQWTHPASPWTSYACSGMTMCDAERREDAYGNVVFAGKIIGVAQYAMVGGIFKDWCCSVAIEDVIDDLDV